MEEFFRQWLARHPLRTDKRLIAVVDSIYRQQGRSGFDSSRYLDIGPRQLRRLFSEHIGVAPKAFARTVRAQQVLRALPQPDFSPYDFGYFDQAHFISDIRSITGLRPSVLKSLLCG